MLWIAILASFVSFLDGTVVTVALPAIGRELGGGLAAQQWIVDAYLITLGALILVAGSLSDVFGRIVVLRIGLIGFGVASLAIAAAPDPLFMIIARGVQGIAGALLVPSSLALITSTFRGKAQARAIGTWTGATTAAMLVGPVLGGAFVDLISWRAVFLINVLPIAATLWLLVALHQKDHREPGVAVDWIGAALCTVGLGGTVFALIEQGRLGWASPAIWATAAGGVVSLIGFLIRQRTAPQPMLPLSLFRIRNFSAGNLSTAFVYGALALNGLVLGVYLQQGAGLSATLAGLASLPSTVIMIVFSSYVGTWSGKIGPRLFMTVGPLVMAVGLALLLTVQEDFNYWTQVLPAVVVYGAGLTLTVAPLTAAILGAIDPTRSGIASAVNNAVARVAGLIAVATLGVITAGVLDLDGFRRAAVVTAALMAIGGIIALIGIRNPARPAEVAAQSDGASGVRAPDGTAAGRAPDGTAPTADGARPGQTPSRTAPVVMPDGAAPTAMGGTDLGQ
ncbi:MFS transporter [Microbacterium kribbense]|uniref:MFS transporter n=1 Tax=Microbacterium kribbense TaxID=433645 RepID=A0ABP7G8T9_9MICO